ncbi:MAG: hypothetical protein GF315_12885 [candidate division Zixibacteria bacterium]|nr:hypothetical protein [candidate division Zixibacteria bacterium]
MGNKVDTKKRAQSTEKKTKSRRRFVRLDVADPIELYHLNLPPKEPNAILDGKVIHGMILNISGSGLLAVIDTKLKVNSFVAITMELHGLEKVEGILGKIKRSERIEKSQYVTGIEFVDIDAIHESYPELDVELLRDDFFNFTDRVQELIAKYVFSRQVIQSGG